MQVRVAILSVIIGIGSVTHGNIKDVLEPSYAIKYAVGWRINDPSPQNVLQLGIIFRCGADWCVEFEEFPGKDNLPRMPLPYRHEMVAPYGKHRCSDGYFTTVHGKVYTDVRARLVHADRRLSVGTERYEYTWERDTSPAGGYVLVKARDIGSDVAFDQVVGFAYESEDQMGRQIRLGDLNAYFNGEIAHKNTRMDVKDDWSQKQSTIDFRKFRYSHDSQLMEYDLPGLPDVVRRFNKPVWVHHSVLAAPAVSARLSYILHEYGHDSNANGCFDEFGHNKLLLPVSHGGLISALIYIEYTHDKLDGVPMMSVGRYFRRQ